MSKTNHEKIIASLIFLLKSKQFEEISIEDICREAGIAKSTFYTYFHSKDDILLNFETPLHDEVMERLPAILQEDSFYEQYKQILLLYADHYYSLPIPLLKKMLATGINKEKNNFSLCVDIPMYGIIRTIIEKGQRNGEISSAFSADEISQIFNYILIGICYNYSAQNGKMDFNKEIEKALILFKPAKEESRKE